jgi:hypothetical protein
VSSHRRLLLVALPCAALACSPDFEPQYRVTDLRILGVRSEVAGTQRQADADLGDRVRLSVLVGNPLGRAPLRVRWATCLPDGSDALSACLDPDALRDLDAFLARPGVLVLGEGTTIEVTVPQVAAAFDAIAARALAEPAFACRLYVELPVVVVAEAGGRREVAVKRVRLVPYRTFAEHPVLAGVYPPNENPGISGVQAAESDTQCGTSAAVPIAAPCGSACPFAACAPDNFCAAVPPDGLVVLCGLARPASSERFDQCAPDGARIAFHEPLDWQWYVTAGTFPESGDGVGNAVGADVEFERPPGAFTLWVIVRDGRGGEGWLARSFPPL